MARRWIAVVLVLSSAMGASALGAGCKSATCEELCERQNDCEGQEPISDCQAYCDAATKSAADTGCSDEYDALLSCQGTVDTCSADTVATLCTAQSAAFLKCTSDACAADPSVCGG